MSNIKDVIDWASRSDPFELAFFFFMSAMSLILIVLCIFLTASLALALVGTGPFINECVAEVPR